MRPERRPEGRGRGVVIAVLTVVLVALAVNAYMIRTNQLDGQKDKTTAAVVGGQQVADEGQSLADEVLAACAAGGKRARTMSAAGLCGKASSAKKNIDQTVKGTPSVPTSSTTIVRRETVPIAILTGIVAGAVDDALLESCGTDGCRDGRDSKVPGPTSTVPGPASTVPGPTGLTGPKGDTPSDETLLALIRRVFAENPPKDGADGDDGTDGRGIASVVCSGGIAPITFTLTYTDGSTDDFSCGGLADD